ncbi:MAG TPA: hypothetical protein PK098_11850 [Phycisphaerales bacterium]|nr:hypothetical protein [Phycisphaerales bacterium]
MLRPIGRSMKSSEGPCFTLCGEAWHSVHEMGSARAEVLIERDRREVKHETCAAWIAALDARLRDRALCARGHGLRRCAVLVSISYTAPMRRAE